MGKLTDIKDSFVKKIRRISITFTVTVHLLYIAYLIFAIYKEIGIRWVNIALAIGTAVFLLVYLIIRLAAKNSRGGIKTTKKFYKRFKLVTRIFSTATAIYTIITAVGSISPIAIFFAGVNAVLLIIRLIFEGILSLFDRKAKRIKKRIKSKFKSTKERKLDYVVDNSSNVETCYITEDDV